MRRLVLMGICLLLSATAVACVADSPDETGVGAGDRRTYDVTEVAPGREVVEVDLIGLERPDVSCDDFDAGQPSLDDPCTCVAAGGGDDCVSAWVDQQLGCNVCAAIVCGCDATDIVHACSTDCDPRPSDVGAAVPADRLRMSP